MFRSLPALLCAALLLSACGKPAEERSEGAITEHVEEMRSLAGRTGEQTEAAAREARDKTDRAMQELERGD